MKNREIAKQKAKEFVSKMTLFEKASQLKYDSAPISRLNIPGYNWWNEGLHGVARAGVATMFPQAIGMAAMFDEEKMKEVADVIATEGRAKYNEYSKHNDCDIYKGLTFWSPNVNIFRDPRWGRGHETYGEDPYLTSRLGVGFVEGLQGDGDIMKAAACAKHYAVHSGPEGIRHEFNAEASKKDMWETYLPAFEALVKEAEVEAVMGAYNRTNGEPCCGSTTLIKEILRDKWGFEGHFVSDCWAIKDFHMHHGVTNNAKESAAMALKAGCDLNCGNIYLHILSAYEDGLITEEDITQATERLYTTRFLLGLFDGSEYDNIDYDVVECKEHINLALDVTQKSLVLLKNDGILPLKKESLKTIGVVGPNANSKAALRGNYYGTSSRYITVLEGIQDEVSDDVRVLYSEGAHLFKDKVEHLAWDNDRISEAVTVAERSDVVILCIGLDETLEGEETDAGNSQGSGDKADLQLPISQRLLLEKVTAVGKPTIVVLMAGSAIDLNYADENCNAILQAWYPGARGGKVVAEALFGGKAPSGKLPVTFYRDLEGMPEFTDYSMKNRTYRFLEEEPLYPFGFGLTYGDISLRKATLIGKPTKDADIEIEAEFINASDIDVEEVVQVYIKDKKSSYAVLNHSLCGFKRIAISAGDVKKVKFIIPNTAMTIVDEKGERYIDSDEFSIYIGTSQPDARSIALTGKTPREIGINL
jgi:beta-glucosidase